MQLLNRAKTVMNLGLVSPRSIKLEPQLRTRGGQLALEGIAFDMAVFSAMNDNPLLADMSFGDQFKQSVMFGLCLGDWVPGGTISPR